MKIEELFQHPEYENYVCVNLALVFVCQVLKPYTEHGLKQVHLTIKTALTGRSQCTGTCGDRSSRWCQPCKNWQKHLQRYSSKHPIDWTKQTTACWEESFENIASVFTLLPGDGTTVNIMDLSNACSIWERCNEFKLQKFVIDNVRECRNKYFAHNESLRVDVNGKAEVFDALKDLLNDKDVQNHINKKFCIDKLEEIEKSTCLVSTISNIKKNFDKKSEKTIKNIKKSTAKVSENSEILKEVKITLTNIHQKQILEASELREYLHGISNKVKNTYKALKMLAVFIIIAFVLTIASRFISDINNPSRSMDYELSDKGAMTSNYKVEWKQAFGTWNESAVQRNSYYIDHFSYEICNIKTGWNRRSILDKSALTSNYKVEWKQAFGTWNESAVQRNSYNIDHFSYEICNMKTGWNRRSILDNISYVRYTDIIHDWKKQVKAWNETFDLWTICTKHFHDEISRLL